jgi:hypothetical protein
MNLLSMFGLQIEPMRVIRAGSSDAILHTVKHFLHRQEWWGHLDPEQALSPDQAMDRLRPCGRIVVGSNAVPSSHWEPPRGEALRAVHDEGYYPRYARLAKRAGAPGLAGSQWARKEGNRWTADVRGYRVVGNLGARSFHVVSAYQIPAVGESLPPAPGMFSIGARLAGLRQKFEIPGSTNGERDDEGST